MLQSIPLSHCPTKVKSVKSLAYRGTLGHCPASVPPLSHTRFDRLSPSSNIENGLLHPAFALLHSLKL